MCLKKYLKFFTSGVATSFEYRGALLTWLVVELVSVSSAVFLWLAVFRTNTNVGDYKSNAMVLYFALIPFVGSFTNSFVADFLPRDIKDGAISKDIIKPYNLRFVVLARQLSIKIAQMIFRMPAYIFVFWILYSSLKIDISISRILLAVAVCPLCFFVHHTLDYFISLWAFFMDDAWALSHLKFILMLIFGGMTFPITIVPDKVRWLFEAMPFKFFYFFPANIALQGIENQRVFVENIVLAIFWIFTFYFLGNFLWAKGVKKYGAYGN
jgi:ABC-2 type transport system permease protein